MTTDVLADFIARGQRQSSVEDWLSFWVALDTPEELKYSFRSIGDDDYCEEIRERRIALLNGVEDNFWFETNGRVLHPGGFKSEPCEFSLNFMGGSRYIDADNQGRVGTGWYAQSTFHFNLDVSPHVARNIIDYPSTLETRIARRCDDPEETIWLRMKFDVTNIAIVQDSESVQFDIAEGTLLTYAAGADDE